METKNEACPICHQRISNWWISTGKTEIVDNLRLHKSCRLDFKLRHGSDWSVGEIAAALSGGGFR